MVLDTARRKYKENTTWLGMRGRDAVRKSTPKVNILQVFTIDFSEIQFIVNHNSPSDGQNKCKEWGELAKEDRTYKLTPEERRRYKGQCDLTLNKASKNGPTKLRSDCKAALMIKNHIHHESREPIEEPIHPSQQRRIQQGQEVFSKDYFSSARVDQHTGWQYWPSSPSFSWWYASEWSWK